MNDSTNSLQEGARAQEIERQIEADVFREKMDRFRTQDSRTLYVPIHSDGRRGPSFDSMTAASLWVVQGPDKLAEGWRVELEMNPAQECLKAAMDMNHLLYGTRPFSQEEEQALASAPNEPMGNDELDVMLGELNREYLRKQRHSDVLHEERTEAHSYPQKSNE